MSEMLNFEWPTVDLGSLLLDIQPGYSSGVHNSSGDGLPHFRPMNVSPEGRIDRTILKFVDPSTGRSNIRLRRGDVLFNNTNSPELVGKTAFFDDDDSPAFSNHMTRLRVDPLRLDPKYLAIRLHQMWREGWFAAHCNNHVSQASIGRDILRALPIELPPLDVQRAISSFAHVVDSRRLSGVNHLSTASRAINRFRQAVLTSACSGRLTSDWREFHGGDEWQAVRAEDVCKKVQSGTTPKSWHQGQDGVPFLKVYNIVDQKLDFDYRPQFISKELHDGPMRRATALPGDVLMNIVGPPLGKVAVVTDQYPEWSINQAITLFRPGSLITTEWLYIFLCSGISVGEVLDYTRGTVGQVNISLSQCRDFSVLLPSIIEQREISRRVETLMTLADKFQQKIERVRVRVSRSQQVILSKAFRGELVESSGGTFEMVS